MLAAAYDLVMILDGLTPAERDLGGISRSLARFLSQRGVDQVWAHAGSDDPEEIRKSLLDTLETCRRNAVDGERFPVHLVCRRNQEGVICGSGRRAGLLTWDELSKRLEVINRAMNGALLVNISSCRGMQEVASFRPPPLKRPSYAMVGFLESVPAGVNRRGYSRFDAIGDMGARNTSGTLRGRYF